MNSNRFIRIKELAAAAAEMSAVECKTYLDRQCAGDEDMRKEVESLLTYDHETISDKPDPEYEDTVQLSPSDNTSPISQDPREQLVSHYRLIRPIGKGGVGEVFAAEDLKLGRTVAIKFLPAGGGTDTQAEKRFINEAQTASALDHPNIGTIHEIDRHHDGRMFIVMGYYEGGSLHDLSQEGPLELDRALDLTCQIARGLEAAHANGIVHRDLKPANVVLSTEGLAKIIDFGLAKLTEQQGMTMTGTLLGTLGYMAPEQIHGKDVDGRTDLFALGVLLFRLVTGAQPFNTDNQASTIYSILNEEPKQLVDLSMEHPPVLQAILDKALTKDPNQRFQSASEMLAALESLRGPDSVDTAATFTAPVPSREKSAPPHRKQILLAAVAFLTIAAAVLGLKLFGQRSSSDIPTEPALAIFDIRDLSGEDDPARSAGITSLISIGMVENCPLHVISPEYLYDLRRREFGKTTGPVADDKALDLARRSGSTLFLSGMIGSLDGETFLTLRLVETSSGETLNAKRFTGGQLTEMADQALEAMLPIVAAHSRQKVPETTTSTSILTTSSDQAYRYFVAGVLAKDANKPNDAVDNLLKAVQLDSTFALAQFELSRIFYSGVSLLVEHGDAMYWADKAWSLKDRLGTKDKLLLEAWRKRLDYRLLETIAIEKRLLEHSPDDRDVLHALLNDYFYFYYFQEALDVAHLGLEHYPDDLDFGIRQTHCLAHLGHAQEALQSAQRYVVDHPREPNAWDELGLRFLALAMPDSGADAFGRALVLDPNFMSSKLGLTYSAYTQGNVDTAIALNEKLLADGELKPGQKVYILTSNAFWPGQAMLNAEAGRFQKSEELFEEAGKYVADPTSILRLETGRSRLWMRQGKAADVLQWARRLTTGPDHRLATAVQIQYTAKALAALDSLDAARTWANRLLVTEESWGGVARYEATKTSAAIHLQAGQAHEALLELKKLADFGIAEGGYFDLEWREMTFEALFLAKRFTEAEQIMLELLKRYGGHAESHFHLGRLYEATGYPGKARAHYEAFLAAWSDADPGHPFIIQAHNSLSVGKS